MDLSFKRLKTKPTSGIINGCVYFIDDDGIYIGVNGVLEPYPNLEQLKTAISTLQGYFTNGVANKSKVLTVNNQITDWNFDPNTYHVRNAQSTMLWSIAVATNSPVANVPLVGLLSSVNYYEVEDNDVARFALIVFGLDYRSGPRCWIRSWCHKNNGETNAEKWSDWKELASDLSSYLKIDGSNGTSSGVSTLLNKLGEGTADVDTKDVKIICEDTGSTTTYVRRPISKFWNWIKSKLTGAISTVLESNLTANRVVISNSNGKLGVSAVTDSQLATLPDKVQVFDKDFSYADSTVTGTTWCRFLTSRADASSTYTVYSEPLLVTVTSGYHNKKPDCVNLILSCHYNTPAITILNTTSNLFIQSFRLVYPNASGNTSNPIYFDIQLNMGSSAGSGNNITMSYRSISGNYGLINPYWKFMDYSVITAAPTTIPDGYLTLEIPNMSNYGGVSNKYMADSFVNFDNIDIQTVWKETRTNPASADDCANGTRVYFLATSENMYNCPEEGWNQVFTFYTANDSRYTVQICFNGTTSSLYKRVKSVTWSNWVKIITSDVNGYITTEGYKIPNGTASQVLTANGGVTTLPDIYNWQQNVNANGYKLLNLKSLALESASDYNTDVTFQLFDKGDNTSAKTRTHYLEMSYESGQWENALYLGGSQLTGFYRGEIGASGSTIYHLALPSKNGTLAVTEDISNIQNQINEILDWKLVYNKTINYRHQPGYALPLLQFNHSTAGKFKVVMRINSTYTICADVNVCGIYANTLTYDIKVKSNSSAAYLSINVVPEDVSSGTPTYNRLMVQFSKLTSSTSIEIQIYAEPTSFGYSAVSSTSLVSWEHSPNNLNLPNTTEQILGNPSSNSVFKSLTLNDLQNQANRILTVDASGKIVASALTISDLNDMSIQLTSYKNSMGRVYITDCTGGNCPIPETAGNYSGGAVVLRDDGALFISGRISGAKKSNSTLSSGTFSLESSRIQMAGIDLSSAFDNSAITISGTSTLTFNLSASFAAGISLSTSLANQIRQSTTKDGSLYISLYK